MQKFPFQRSFLKKQKVLKRNQKKKQGTKKSLLLPIFFLCLLSLLLFFFKKISHPLKEKVLFPIELSPSWEVKIVSTLQNKSQNKVLEYFEKKEKKQESLTAIAKELQKKFSFAQATIIQTGKKKLNIYLKERSPLFRITADKARFVSKTGEIYGFAEEEKRFFPQLTNILDKNRKNYAFTPRGNLITTEEEELKIAEAKTILSLTKKFSLSLEEISFIDYRGFKIRLKDQETQIVLGRHPFEYKFVKLLEIQKQLKEKNQTAWRIELDYEGKAFIKTSKKGEKVDS